MGCFCHGCYSVAGFPRCCCCPGCEKIGDQLECLISKDCKNAVIFCGAKDISQQGSRKAPASNSVYENKENISLGRKFGTKGKTNYGSWSTRCINKI